jgi:C-terminal processing protease CtpA/Prc
VIYVDDVDTVQTTTAYDLEHFGVVLDDQYDDRIVIVEVYPNTPAYAAGLRAGDVITTWHGQRISTPREFTRVIERAEPGTVNFEYSRNDRTVRADANLRRETFRNERATDRAERRISRDANRVGTDVRTGESVRQPARGQTVPEASRDRQQDRREGTRPVVPGGGLLPRNR